jgi:hypothetical protein
MKESNMNTMLQNCRIARHDYERVMRAYRESGSPDLGDQARGKKAVLLEKEDAIAAWIESFGFVETNKRDTGWR